MRHIKKFDKKYLLQLIDGDHGEDLLDHYISSRGRWTIRYQVVFLDVETRQPYMFDYQVGATEQQDTDPFDNIDEDMIDCYLCKEVPTIKYVPVNINA